MKATDPVDRTGSTVNKVPPVNTVNPGVHAAMNEPPTRSDHTAPAPRVARRGVVDGSHIRRNHLRRPHVKAETLR